MTGRHPWPPPSVRVPAEDPEAVRIRDRAHWAEIEEDEEDDEHGEE